ncbi:MAG: hypothetical protein AAGA48_27535 [Myxococcota bacterium]
MPWWFWLEAAPPAIQSWAREFDDAEMAWSFCDRVDWLWGALALAAAARRTLVGSMCEALRSAIQRAHSDLAYHDARLEWAEAWAQSRALVEAPQGAKPIPEAFRPCANLLLVSASADPIAACHTAIELGARLTDRQALEAVWELRWPFANAPVHRWPEAVQVAWDRLVERTRTRTDLSTLEVLCSRSLLPELSNVPRLKLGVIRERLFLAPDLAPEVERLTRDL